MAKLDETPEIEENLNKSEVGAEKSQVSASIDSEDFIQENVKNRHKGRTPSGNDLTLDFQDIRGFFSPTNIDNMKKRKRNDSTTSQIGTRSSQRIKATHLKVQQSIATKLKGKAKRLAINKSHTSVRTRQNKPKDLDVDSDDSYTSISSSASTPVTLNEEEENVSDAFLRHLAVTINKTSKDKLYIPELNQGEVEIDKNELQEEQYQSDQQLEEPSQNMECEDSVRENPQVLGLATIAEMFRQLKEEIKTDIDGLRTDFADVKKNKNLKVSQAAIKNCTEKVMDNVDAHCKKDQKMIQDLRKEVEHFKFRNKTLTNVVDRMAGEMGELKSRIENLEISSSKKAVTLTGYKIIATRKYEIIVELENFFDLFMGLSVKIDDFFTMGSKQPRMIVIYFQAMQNKRDAIRFKYLLKNADYDRALYINEYTPAATQEKRRQEDQLILENQELDTRFTKQGLSIQGEVFKPKVSVPTPKDLVDLSPQEIKDIMKLPLTNAGTITQEKSIFQGFTAAVSNFAQIRLLYIKMKLLHPHARHIVCVYNLDSSPDYYTKGFCDDAEPGAGNKIFKFCQTS